MKRKTAKKPVKYSCNVVKNQQKFKDFSTKSKLLGTWKDTPKYRLSPFLLQDIGQARKIIDTGKVPAPEDIRWFTGARKAAAFVQPEITLTKEQAASAAEGLGRFADWFATQIVDIEGAVKELRSVEKFESTLRSTAGLSAISSRPVPGEIQPDTSPPDIF